MYKDFLFKSRAKTTALATAAALVLSGLGGAVSAATYDFRAIANGAGFTDSTNTARPGGEADWNTRVGAGVGILDVGTGISVVGSATTSAQSSILAYFDGGAGLGACSVVTASGQCNPANDDNVGAIGGSANAGDGTFETLLLTFSETVKLTGMQFRAEGHGLFNGSVKINGIATAIAGGAWSGPLIGSVFSFEYIPVASTAGSTNEFYIGTATVSPIPVPAAGVLLFTALAGGAAFGHRRKTRA